MPSCYNKFSVVEFTSPLSKRVNSTHHHQQQQQQHNMDCTTEMPRKRGRPIKNPNNSCVKMLITKTEMFNSTLTSFEFKSHTPTKYPYESEMRISSGITKKKKQQQQQQKNLSCTFTPSSTIVLLNEISPCNSPSSNSISFTEQCNLLNHVNNRTPSPISSSSSTCPSNTTQDNNTSLCNPSITSITPSKRIIRTSISIKELLN